MKSLFKKLLANYLSLQLIGLLIPEGFKVERGLTSYFVASILLVFLFPLLKQLLKIILLPLSFLTLGLINLFLSFLLFYLLTLLLPEIRISPFTFHSLIFMGFSLPTVVLSRFWTFALASLIFTFSNKFLSWLIS